MFTRYDGYRGNKIPGADQNTGTAALQLVLAYQGLEEENLDQKSPDLPGWGGGGDAKGQPPAHRKNRKLLPKKAH